MNTHQSDGYARVFRILRETVGVEDEAKHRAMTMRALVELAEALTERNHG